MKMSWQREKFEAILRETEIVPPGKSLKLKELAFMYKLVFVWIKGNLKTKSIRTLL